MAEGVALSPSMCSRDTEPPSFGNVLWTAHAAGKPRAELAGIECVSGS